MGNARRVVGIVGVLLAVAVAGCGSTDSGASDTTEPEGDAGASATTSTTSAPVLPAALPTPVCDLVDLTQVAGALGAAQVLHGEIRASQLTVPAYDICRLDAYASDSSVSWLAIGVSVMPADAESLAASRAAYDSAAGEQGPARDVVGVGDGGYGTDRFAVVLASDRLVSVSSGLTSGTENFATYSALAGLFAPLVADLGPIPLTVTEPACDAAAADAEALLGGPATVRRDEQEGGSLICGWADADSSAYIDCFAADTAAAEVQAQLEYKPDGRPIEVGDTSLFSPSNSTIDFSVRGSKHCIVGAFPAGPHPEAGLVALAKKTVTLVD